MGDTYVIVDSQELMDEFLDRAGGFHDALIREVAILNQGYVDSNGRMSGDLAPCDARMIFHSQYPQPAYIEIVFAAVQRFRLENYHVLSGDAEGTVSKDEVRICFGDGPSRDKDMVPAGAMKYRILGPDWLGKELRTVEAIPVDDDRCPACGYDGLWFKPWDGDSPADEICPCCGIQFGYDDCTGGTS